MERLQKEHKKLIKDVYNILIMLDIFDPEETSLIDWMEKCLEKAVEMEEYENAAMIVKYIKEEKNN